MQVDINRNNPLSAYADADSDFGVCECVSFIYIYIYILFIPFNKFTKTTSFSILYRVMFMA